jgi:hypothetical protein
MERRRPTEKGNDVNVKRQMRSQAARGTGTDALFVVPPAAPGVAPDTQGEGIMRSIVSDRLLIDGDHHMHLANLKSYFAADQRLCELYAHGDGSARRAFLHVAGSPPNTPARSGTQNPVRWLEEKPPMTISPLAGKPAPKEMLIDPARLEREYFERKPDLDDPGQLVSFGTSGHRGSPFRGS